MREFYFSKWLFEMHSIWILGTLFKEVAKNWTRKCAFNCNYHKKRSQFKCRSVIKYVDTVPIYFYGRYSKLSKMNLSKHWAILSIWKHLAHELRIDTDFMREKNTQALSLWKIKWFFADCGFFIRCQGF